jgi:glutamate/aspartate transport system substrate-binding protein
MNRIVHTALAAAAVVFAGALPGAPSAWAQESPTLKKIKAAGEIAVGHREASVPFAFMNKEGKPEGYSIDICMKIVDEVKKELNMPSLKVKFVPINAQTRIPLIANGTIDMECGSTTSNLTRAKQVDFLPVTFITGSKLLVKKGSGIKSLNDMNGKRISYSSGTTNEKVFLAEAEKRKLKVESVPVKDHPQAMLNLESGRVDAYVSDDVLLYGMVSTAKDPSQWEVVGEFFSYDPYSLMIPRNDSDYRLLATRVVADLMRSGEMEKIYNKWFNPGPTNIKMPLSADLKKAFEIQALPY